MKNSYGSINLNSNNESKGLLSKSRKDEKLRLLENEYVNETSTSTTTGASTSVDMENLVSNIDDINNEQNPMLKRDLEHPTSNFDTMIHLLKGNVGTGILAMPDAFRNAGWVIGLFGTLFMGFICTHCMHMLVNCSHELCKRTRQPSMNFAEVVENAFRTGPESIQKYSNLAKSMINIFLCITQLGFCCVYFVFVAANLHDIIKHYFIDISVHWYLLMLLIPMILLNFVKNLKYLTPSSLIASILTTSGLIITFIYMLQDLPSTDTIDAFAPISKLPLYFGTAVYAFEGIGVVLPLENNMKTPEDFGGWSGVLNTGMVIVAVLYTAIGFFGYLKYGDRAVLGSVTLLLPADELAAQLVRLMMAIAIFLSYSLQFYVAFNIVWPHVKVYFNTERSLRFAELITRTLLVFITFALAIAIPNLGAVISLVGAFSSSALALIFPPLIEIITFWPTRNKLSNTNYCWLLCKNLIIILFGFIGFLIGSYVSLLNIISS